MLLLVLIIGSSEENSDHDQEHEQEKSEQATLKPFLVSLSRSVPNGRICFAFELVNEGCCPTQPFEPLLVGEPVKLSVPVEILGLALSQRAFEFCGRLDFTLSIFHFGPAIFPVV